MEQSTAPDQSKIWYWWMAELAYNWNSSVEVNLVDLRKRLAHHTKAELVDLIGKMIAHEPDLAALIEEPAPHKVELESSPKAKAIRQQVRQIFHRVVHQPHACYALSLELLDLIEVGDRQVAQQNCQEAFVIYNAVIREVMENYDLVDNSEGELFQVIYRANQGLSKCLTDSSDPYFRQTILRVLFDTYVWDAECGGADLGFETIDIIAHATTPPEKQILIQWAEAVLPGGNSRRDNFRRQIYQAGLAKLRAM
jgi:hypothetical protein